MTSSAHEPQIMESESLLVDENVVVLNTPRIRPRCAVAATCVLLAAAALVGSVTKASWDDSLKLSTDAVSTINKVEEKGDADEIHQQLQELSQLQKDDCKRRRAMLSVQLMGSGRRVERRLRKSGKEITIPKDENDISDDDPCKINEAAALKAAAMAEYEDQAQKAVGPDTALIKSKHDANASEVVIVPETSTTAESGPNITTTEDGRQCSGPQEDCRTTKCCSEPGMQCYEKSEFWGMCQESCTPGPDPTDVDPDTWTCKEIGTRTPGESKQCSNPGEDCRSTKCCTEIGSACFSKNDKWATCKATCIPGPDQTDKEWGLWKCEQLGPFKNGAASWVTEKCSGNEDNCMESQCCISAGYQCYEKGEFWAQCKPSCEPGVDPEREWDGEWTCKERGSRTPPQKQMDGGAGPPGGKVGAWVADKCAKTGTEDCSKSQCCTGAGMQCYQKNDKWAACMESCEPGHRDESNETWSCNTLGQKSFGLATKGWPSLLCFSVMRLQSYERALIEVQIERKAGIFACDETLLLAAGDSADVMGVKTISLPDVAVGVSMDGTAANTELFMKVWDAVIEQGHYTLHDWTVKVDPDAVVLPDRVRNHLVDHTENGEHDGKLFVVNCNAWPSAATFPMMYGSLEVFSRKAMDAYAQTVWKCAQELPWQEWGEDFFITRCMDQVDVGRLLDFNIIGDNLCVGPGQGGAGNCDNPVQAAFHPFKEKDDWVRCFENAVR